MHPTSHKNSIASSFRRFWSSKSSNNKSTDTRPQITALLIDLSGTLHIGSTPTQNAVDAYHRLRQSLIPFRLCSNTSKESTAALVKRLDKMGFGISESDPKTGIDTKDKLLQHRIIWTSLGAVTKVIKDMGLKEPFLLLSDSAREEVLSDIDRKPQEGGAALPPAYDSVVVGHAPSHFDYSSLNTAFRILKGEVTPPMDISTPVAAVNHHAANVGANHSKPVPLIATHKAKYVQTESGLSLGPGPFVTALETASDVAAHVVGKPTKEFFQTVIQDFTKEELPMGHEPKDNARGRIAVIGDDVEADLGEGALELGLWRVLVKTGKYRPGDENRPGVIPPDEVFDSYADFINSLLSDAK